MPSLWIPCVELHRGYDLTSGQILVYAGWWPEVCGYAQKNGERFLCFLPKVEKSKSGKSVSQVNTSSLIVESEKRIKLKTPDELLDVLQDRCFIRVRIYYSGPSLTCLQWKLFSYILNYWKIYWIFVCQVKFNRLIFFIQKIFT